MYHARIKHIDVRFHKIKEFVSSSELLLEKIHNYEKVANMLTKSFTTISFALRKSITTVKFKHCINLIIVSKCKIGDILT